jgi:alkylhydroperoxidase/carboxymuconolactone decarboxylase family protein YurZ
MMAQEYLPKVYVRFREDYPAVAAALDGLGEAADAAGPLDERAVRLVKLGMAIGHAAEGAVRSNARKALAAGATPEELRHVAVLAFTTCGFPTGIAGLGWINEVLDGETADRPA